MSGRRIATLARHLTNNRIQAQGYSTAADGGNYPYVPQYSNRDHPVLKCRKRLNILDSWISYLDTGIGDKVVVFLHGNPTSSYLWRNVMLQVKGTARCIAPDLIGHGLSGSEPNHQYRMKDHYKYLSAWIDALKLPQKISLVVHDWGAGVGMQWAYNNQHRIESLMYLEAALGVAPSWEAMSKPQQHIYGIIRSPQADDFIASEQNWFSDGMFSQIQRKLLPEEEFMWKARFEQPGENRRPIVTWCREVPIKGDGPDDNIEIFNKVRRWISEERNIPKLYIHITPGMLAFNNVVVTKKWHNQKVAQARGLHFAQEDDPVTIGDEIATFLKQNVYKN